MSTIELAQKISSCRNICQRLLGENWKEDIKYDAYKELLLTKMDEMPTKNVVEAAIALAEDDFEADKFDILRIFATVAEMLDEDNSL